MKCACQYISNAACGLGMVSSGIVRGLSVIELAEKPFHAPTGGYVIHYRGPMSHLVFGSEPRNKRLVWSMLDREGHAILKHFEPGAAEAWSAVQRVLPIMADLESAAAERCAFPATHADALAELAALRNRVNELEAALSNQGGPR